MKKILIGTTNKGKFREITEILGSLECKLLMPSDLNITKSPNESGSTYKENAIIKAKFYAKKSKGITVVAEDSGIEIEALPGELGHLTRRWGKGENATDKEWLEHFLEIMKKQKNRSATFKCTVAVIHKNKLHIFHGECRGKIILKPEVQPPHGIPISACFIPEGATKAYAALTPKEKNHISHRGRAMHQVKKFLEKITTQSSGMI